MATQGSAQVLWASVDRKWLQSLKVIATDKRSRQGRLCLSSPLWAELGLKRGSKGGVGAPLEFPETSREGGEGDGSE